MNKTVRLKLSKYRPIPLSLRLGAREDSAIDSLSINLASLYHHYYLDSYGVSPPDPDPAKFEHSHFLLPIPEFRFQGDGIGDSPAVRRHRSNELGQAFCRWFLYEHIGVTYFAHVERIINRQLKRPFKGFRLERIAGGDTPDYLCSSGNLNVCLAEAKGRFSAVSFKNKKFEEWRQQFARVAFKDDTGNARPLKGHIVATRFATEEDSAKLKSTIFAEDPQSVGDGEPSSDSMSQLSAAVRAAHFGHVAQKLRQPILASALVTGVDMPEELRVSAVAWRVLMGPLEGRRFVGGYFAIDDTPATLKRVDGGLAYYRPDPLRLDQPGYSFFGIEESIFRQVVQMARGGRQVAEIQRFEATDFFYSGFSVFRDGTALGPLEFFVPDEQIAL